MRSIGDMQTLRGIGYLTIQLARVAAFVAGVYGVALVCFVLG